jgi:hypothetical protein
VVVSGSSRYRLYLALPVGTAAYVGLALWSTLEGARHSGSNVQTAFLFASLVAVWPVAWGWSVWPAVVRAGFSRRARALIALAVSQMAIAAVVAYLQAASVTSYFKALPLPLLAFVMGIFWYAWLGIKRAERATDSQ